MKLLIIQTAFIGDVILATALIEKLHRFYPDATLDFVLRKGNESLLQGYPHVRKIYIWDKKQGKYRDLYRILREVRREEYDEVINCQRFAASGLLTVWSGAKRTTGFDKNPLAYFFSTALPHRIGSGASRFGFPYWHEVDRNLSLIDHLTDTTPERPRLYPQATDWNTVATLSGGQPYICIAPTSVWFTKQWPAGKWIQLVGALPAAYRIFLLGAPGDFEAGEGIKRSSTHENIVNLAGKISLITSAALMSGAAMNYVNDSAPLHLASALNAPVKAIFCSTIPEFGFTPLSDRSEVLQTNAILDCRPCGLHGYKACPKGHFNCANIEVT